MDGWVTAKDENLKDTIDDVARLGYKIATCQDARISFRCLFRPFTIT